MLRTQKDRQSAGLFAVPSCHTCERVVKSLLGLVPNVLLTSPHQRISTTTNTRSKNLLVTKIAPVRAVSFGRAVSRIMPGARRPTGTDLSIAEQIMGWNHMHRIPQVSKRLGLGESFHKEHPHLNKVPYTREVLEWAAKAGFVLTLRACGLDHLVEVAGDKLRVAAGQHSAAEPHTFPLPQWCLVLRAISLGLELKTLRTMPAALRRLKTEASVSVMASAMYLDYLIHGIMPDGLRLTSSSGMTGKPLLVGRDAQQRTMISVLASRHDELHYTEAVMLRPQTP